MKSRPATSTARVDNRLAFLDQASFLRLRATGVDTVGQVTWVYDRPVDLNGLRRFNQNLGRGLLGRRIERSPLPFGRHRWIASHRAPDIDITASPRPRAEISTWMDERGQIPVDPEHGPCWHLGVLPLDDGGTAVSLVTSHTVADGVAVSIAIGEAVKGEVRDFGYPSPRSRSRLRGFVVDALDTLHGLPEAFRAFIACIMILLKRDSDTANQPKSPSPPKSPPLSTSRESDKPFIVPSTTLLVDLASWDARALDLGGSSNSLLIALATQLAVLMGRVSPADSTVTISVPVSERSADDTRGNALTAITLRVDSTRATTDLQVIRNEMKQGLAALEQNPNELLKPLPLIPFVPKWLARKMEALALGTSDLPVCCSNLRDLDQSLARIDGTDSRDVSARLFTRGATREGAEQSHGDLYLFSGRINGKIYISISGYGSGAESTKNHLCELIKEALADYQLTAEMYE